MGFASQANIHALFSLKSITEGGWGFGRQVIQQIPAQALTGNVTHEFLPHGVRWALDIPATFVVDAQSKSASARPYMHSRRNEMDQHVSQ